MAIRDVYIIRGPPSITWSDKGENIKGWKRMDIKSASDTTAPSFVHIIRFTLERSRNLRQARARFDGIHVTEGPVHTGTAPRTTRRRQWEATVQIRPHTTAVHTPVPTSSL